MAALVSKLFPPATVEDWDSAVPDLEDSHIRSVALKIYETLHGARTISQLSRHVVPSLLHKIQLQRSLRSERGQVYAKNIRIVPMPGRVTRSETSSRKVFCVVVLHSSARSFSFSLCFEHYREAWRVTEADLL